jgi:hypothetical protein
MPTNVVKLAKELQKLSLALARQSTERQELEVAHVKKTAKILTTIANLMGDVSGIDIKDLGTKFADACSHGGGGGPRPVKGSK